MIRKVTRYDAPAAAVRSMFRETDDWPRWMPSVASTRTLAEDDGLRLVEVVLLMFGHRLVQKLECRESDGRLTHRQVEGWFKKWEATWTFQPPADGSGGTIVSLRLDFDLGVAGLLVPRKSFNNWVSGLMDGTIDHGRRRALRFARREREPTQAVEVGQPLLQVFETADGFEIFFAGQTFHIDARDLPGTHGDAEG